MLSQSSLRAQRSNPGSLRGDSLDCFAALAMTACSTCLVLPLALEIAATSTDHHGLARIFAMARYVDSLKPDVPELDP
ncbi:hypothetical protein FXB38_26140 [Bradyrhizobium cytisi]|uniref:Uncharacterized protein n=1 Tax=Bradyrhizobium cytisi TaxID=515489 RepID=A0A5S4WFT7_9BRAD|nr:hypothetical protein FXB38_26140 [Bradyrhizobium cytisi]